MKSIPDSFDFTSELISTASEKESRESGKLQRENNNKRCDCVSVVKFEKKMHGVQPDFVLV